MKKIAISLFLLGASTSLMARPMYHDKGFYLSLLGGSSYMYNTHANGFSYSKFDHFGNTVIGNMGYQFNSNFATEMDLGYYHPTVDSNIAKIYQPAAVLKGIIPLAGNFSLYGKLGVAENMYRYTYANQSGHNETRSLLGLGAAFSVTQRFEVNVVAQSTLGRYKDSNDSTQKGWDGISLVGVGISLYF